MLSIRELMSQLQLYLSLILLYHPARPILNYFISLLITALCLFLKLYHANYWFLNSVRQFFVKLNWIKPGIEHNKKELKYYGIETTILGKTTWENVFINAHYLTQQNYSQINSFA